ncbi:HD domain-containing protein [Methanolobus psychrotolerans]|uniref:HD domain-containing protein n=1 Tax=Methanolobus psychrotolerans TaxID=1874706 RepID=UPI000B918F1F|nr:HD domain-containing protein [Methanolobus psychrotolerans]
MKEEDFLNFNEWFYHYVRSFYSDDAFIQQNVILKEEHSIRVCDNVSLIARSENLDAEDYNLARTIALFHDIGRFEQILKYRTFKDSESENHALLGMEILKAAGILSDLPSEEQEIILTAIMNHNIQRIPDGLDQRTLLHSRLIRDADKLDIYQVLTDYYEIKKTSPNPAIDMGLSDISEYSPDLIKDIFANKVLSVKNIRTCNDMKLTRLAWLFDLNFIETFRLVRERGYIDKVINSLPHNREIDGLHTYLKKYMDSILE